MPPGVNPSESVGTESENTISVSENGTKVSENASSVSENDSTESENASLVLEKGSTDSENTSSVSENGTKELENASSVSENGSTESENASLVFEKGHTDSEYASLVSENGTKESENASSVSENGSTESENASLVLEKGNTDSEYASLVSENGTKESENTSPVSENGTKESENASSVFEKGITELENAISVLKFGNTALKNVSTLESIIAGDEEDVEMNTSSKIDIAKYRSLTEESLLTNEMVFSKVMKMKMPSTCSPRLQLESLISDSFHKLVNLSAGDMRPIDIERLLKLIDAYSPYNTTRKQLREKSYHFNICFQLDDIEIKIAAVKRQIKDCVEETAFKHYGNTDKTMEKRIGRFFTQMTKMRMSTLVNERGVSASGKQTLLGKTQLNEALIREYFSIAMTNSRNNKGKIPLVVLWPLVFFDPEQIQEFERLRLFSVVSDNLYC